MNKVTVSNKIGNRFFIQVPESLLFEGITFEGIDSLQNYNSPLINQEGRDCHWTSQAEPWCPNLEKDDQFADDYIVVDKNQICQFRSY
jgi:hypothetical protein